VGTVGFGRSAVAVFRINGETLFVRPAQVIANWHVHRILEGHVWLSRKEKWYTAGVGDTFTLGSSVAVAAAPPSETPSPS
jgi:hypothetical protein